MGSVQSRGLTESSLRGRFVDGREGLERGQPAPAEENAQVGEQAVALGSGGGRPRMSRLDDAHEDLGSATREGREEIAKRQS